MFEHIFSSRDLFDFEGKNHLLVTIGNERVNF